MKGFIGSGSGIKGMLNSAMAGVGTASVMNNVMPNTIPMQEEIVAIATGGIPGAIAIVGIKKLPTMFSKSGITSSGVVLN